MFYNRISQEHQRLCQQISSLQAELANYPAGQLICCHQGTRCKWYHSDGHSRTYIPKKQRSYAEQLAAKKYLESLLKDLTEEKEALQSYLKKHPNTHSRHYFAGVPYLNAKSFQPLHSQMFANRHKAYNKSKTAAQRQRNCNHDRVHFTDRKETNNSRKKLEPLHHIFYRLII